MVLPEQSMEHYQPIVPKTHLPTTSSEVFSQKSHVNQTGGLSTHGIPEEECTMEMCPVHQRVDSLHEVWNSTGDVALPSKTNHCDSEEWKPTSLEAIHAEITPSLSSSSSSSSSSSITTNLNQENQQGDGTMLSVFDIFRV